MTPPLRPGFVNRVKEISVLKSWLLRESNGRQPIALVGLGGMGKTALARIVCHDDGVIEAFEDGILWMTLGAQPNLLGAVAPVLVAFGDTARLEQMDDVEKRLGEYLSDKRCLIVVDEVADSALLRMLVRIGPACRLLITTRFQAIAEEVGADVVSLSPLPIEEASRWVAQQGVSLQMAQALSEKLGSVPLALELGQQALRKGVPLSDLLRRLDDEGLTALDAGTSRDPASSLFATLMLTVEALPPDDRARLPSVATLPAGKSVDISQFAAATGLSSREAEAMMKRLAAASLAEYSEQTVRIVEPVHGFLRSLKLRQERAEAARRAPGQRSDGSIWICYRREDSGAYAGRLYDRLTSRHGLDRVFLDVDSATVGADFVEAIETRIRQLSAMLVVIGPQWMGVKDSSGERRLDDPDDFVRHEIEIALRHDVPIVPILVGGASMPRASELPASLHPLARRQALELSDARYEQDVDRLNAALERLTPRKPRPVSSLTSPVPRRIRRLAVGAGIAALVVLLLSVGLWNRSPSPASASMVRVPSVVGLSTGDLAKVANELDVRFVMTDGNKVVDFIDGLVTAQLPIPDTQIERGRSVTVTVAPRPISPIPLLVSMQKGRQLIEGNANERVGERQDGVVTSLTVAFQTNEPELQLKREMFYMTDTGRSDSGGPVMGTASTGAGDARDRVLFPKGVRGVRFWLEGARSKQYTVRYEVRLSDGSGGEARDGSQAGNWTPTTSSTQHQLVWLAVSVLPRPEATTK